MKNNNDFLGRILIVEDNLDIATLLCDFFIEQNHVVDCAHDGLTALHLVASNSYDIILLDLALPGIDGIELCKKMRQQMNSSVPVLMLTARDSLDEKLTGFDAGADDYLVKPFDLLEVQARVQALWRRSVCGMQQVLQVADLKMDLQTMQVSRGGQTLKLNPLRLKLLRRLMENSHRVVARNELETAVWGDMPTESDALRTHISALRQSIDKPFSQPLLQTIHGIGYRLHETH